MGPVLIWAAVTCSVLALAGTLVLGWATLPAQLERQLRRSRRDVAEVFARVDEIENEWRRTRKGMEGYLEELETLTNTLESKRKRVAAAESRQKRQQEVEPAPMGSEARRLQLLSAARSQGHPV